MLRDCLRSGTQPAAWELQGAYDGFSGKFGSLAASAATILEQNKRLKLQAAARPRVFPPGRVPLPQRGVCGRPGLKRGQRDQ